MTTQKWNQFLLGSPWYQIHTKFHFFSAKPTLEWNKHRRAINDTALNVLAFLIYDSKASVYNAGDPGSIPGLGRSPGKGSGNPLKDYCLENPMDRGAW